MNRKEFLRTLKTELRKRRDIDIEEVIFYYDELIQDAVENGENERDFIEKLGSVRNITRKIVDDETFVIEMREQNQKVIKSALGLTVKLISYFIFGIVAIVIASVAFSLFVSGAAIALQTVIRSIATPPQDIYGYFMLFGFIVVGIALILVSVGFVQLLFKQAKSTLLSIIRKIRN